jgi:DNA adenine methylase
MNDADGNLTNLYQVIRNRTSEFVSEISKLAYSEVLFQQFKEDIKTGKKMSDMERAVSYYYFRFCAFRGNMKNPEFRISKEQNFAELYQENLERVIALSERLKSVTILNRDFRKVLKNYNSSNVFVYADSPYIDTEHYYAVEFGWQDHVVLAEMLKAHKGKFALSCKAKREVRKLYRSNRHFCLDFEVSNREKNMRNNEKLIFNFKFEHKNRNGVSNLKPFC